MAEFNLNELLALQELGYWLEVHLMWLLVMLYFWSAWKFFKSPDRPPHPQRYRKVPAIFVIAFVIHLILCATRAFVLERPPILTPFEARSFFGLVIIFVSLIGCRRFGEAPIAGTMSSIAAGSLLFSALVFASPAALPLPILLRSPWFQGHRTLVIIGYSLVFVALVVRLSLRLRPSLTERVAVRGLIASGDILTDHPHRSLWLYRTGVPFLLLSLVTRLHWNGIALGHHFDWSMDLLLNLIIVIAIFIHQHWIAAEDDPEVTRRENLVGGFLSRLVLTSRGSLFFLVIAFIFVGGMVLLPGDKGLPADRYMGTLAASVAILLSLVPCLMRRTRLRFVDSLALPRFEELMKHPSDRKPTVLDVQNPQLSKADLDDAFIILGFKSYPFEDPDVTNGAVIFGTPTTVYGYFSHLFLVPTLLILPLCVSSEAVHTFYCKNNETIEVPKEMRAKLGTDKVRLGQSVVRYCESPTVSYPKATIDRLLSAIFLNSTPMKVAIDKEKVYETSTQTRLQIGNNTERTSLAWGKPLTINAIQISQGKPQWEISLKAKLQSGAIKRVKLLAGQKIPEGFVGACIRLSSDVQKGLVKRVNGRSELMDSAVVKLISEKETKALKVGETIYQSDGTLQLEAVTPLTTIIFTSNQFFRILELLLLIVGFLLLARALIPWYLVIFQLTHKRESCTVDMQVYSGGLVSSPSKMIKQLTGHLVMEHESMF